MRLLILLASTTMPAACGGAGPQFAGSSAPPTGGGGTGGGTGSGTSHTFVDPTESKTYTAVGATHSYGYTVEAAGSAGAGQSGQLYQGDATTVRNSDLTIENPDGSTTEFIRQINRLERGAFSYGEITPNDQVPTTGTGSFEGTMLASMVFNDQPDKTGNFDTYFQWIAGRATTNVNFGTNTFSLSLDGKVGAPFLDGTSGQHSVMENALFRANGAGDINLVSAGGFFGQFNEAWFVNPGGNRLDLVIAGSSINGAFYGPNGVELGGGYRIVGGTPDERIDILGTFVGKRP